MGFLAFFSQEEGHEGEEDGEIGGVTKETHGDLLGQYQQEWPDKFRSTSVGNLELSIMAKQIYCSLIICGGLLVLNQLKVKLLLLEDNVLTRKLLVQPFSWNKPADGWRELNVDGSPNGNLGSGSNLEAEALDCNLDFNNVWLNIFCE
ncbi:hypothetical protein ACH5RR_018264 [Cinchona calisaya]|uniref:Uncharacterized protein n=1 Tax=Cinchona calisaya TaxID=153742 RepID=A0ABD2ZKY8_9GENT